MPKILKQDHMAILAIIATIALMFEGLVAHLVVGTIIWLMVFIYSFSYFRSQKVVSEAYNAGEKAAKSAARKSSYQERKLFVQQVKAAIELNTKAQATVFNRTNILFVGATRTYVMTPKGIKEDAEIYVAHPTVRVKPQNDSHQLQNGSSNGKLMSAVDINALAAEAAAAEDADYYYAS